MPAGRSSGVRATSTNRCTSSGTTRSPVSRNGPFGTATTPTSATPSRTAPHTSSGRAAVVTPTSTPGWRLRNPPISPANGLTACDGIDEIDNRPPRSPSTARTVAFATSNDRTSSRAGPTNACPAAFSTNRRPVRWNSSHPSSRSSFRKACDTDGCATCSRTAAWCTLSASTTARKYRICRTSIHAPVRHQGL